MTNLLLLYEHQSKSKNVSCRQSQAHLTRILLWCAQQMVLLNHFFLCYGSQLCVTDKYALLYKGKILQCDTLLGILCLLLLSPTQAQLHNVKQSNVWYCEGHNLCKTVTDLCLNKYFKHLGERGSPFNICPQFI